ncbi:hypothetical protein RRG08_025120 [Elysia crispata]|uniref:Uncharacterized protein n=1 Tax=Elysia crispata TaxID=231223 RepID=A0AAE1AJ08_9GAST|nr:hypothetical protein RRG08_025120 [Elysia crispata]
MQQVSLYRVRSIPHTHEGAFWLAIHYYKSPILTSYSSYTVMSSGQYLAAVGRRNSFPDFTCSGSLESDIEKRSKSHLKRNNTVSHTSESLEGFFKIVSETFIAVLSVA